MNINSGLLIAGAIVVTVAAGCSRYQVIPDRLAAKVNTQLSYEQVKTSPHTHRGQLVVWGGEVLSAFRDGNRTRIEVLQVPLNSDYIPLSGKPSSRGRFFALDSQREIIDPAILEEGSRITIVGEILGEIAGASADQASASYPAVTIRDMTVWNSYSRPYFPYSYASYYGYGYHGYRPYTFWEGAHVPGS